MADGHCKRPSFVPPLVLKRVNDGAGQERMVGAKAALSPHCRAHSPTGLSLSSVSPIPPKRRKKSNKELVHELLVELRREHAYGPNKIIVGGSVARSPTPRSSSAVMKSTTSSKHSTPRIEEGVAADSPLLSESGVNNPPPKVVHESSSMIKSVDNTPRSVLSHMSSGSNTPIDLFLEFGTGCFESKLVLEDPCLQVHTSTQETQTEHQAARCRGMQTETVELEVSSSCSPRIQTHSCSTEDGDTQTTPRANDEPHAHDKSEALAELRHQVRQLEEEKRLKYAQMKATALEEVYQLMGQMQRSHEEVEGMFSARIEELEERLRGKEEECAELEAAVAELDAMAHSERADANHRLNRVESRLDSVSTSLLLRRSVGGALLGFIADRTMHIPAFRKLSAALLPPAAGISALEYYPPPVSGFGPILGLFSVTVIGALQIHPDSACDMLPADAAKARPYTAYIVRCKVVAHPRNDEETDDEEEEKEEEGAAAQECEFCVLRRFSDFASLYASLSDKLCKDARRALPPLPPKRWFRPCAHSVVSERMAGLGRLVQALPSACRRNDAASEAALDFLIGRKEDSLPTDLDVSA